MPYNGDIYSPPAGTKGAPKTTIQSSKYNTFLDDITDAQNTPRPISGGGTGATNITKMLENFGLDKVLKYGSAQTLVTSEKTQAIANISGGFLAGFRNKLINPIGAVNQRGVSGSVVLAAGQYGHDRFKAGSSGCTYTFSTVNGVTTFTITAGTILQAIEASAFSGMAGNYVLGWEGNAQARINGGSYSTSGNVSAVLNGGANAIVEWGVGTLALPHLDFDYLTAISPRHLQQELALCQRYTWVTSADGCIGLVQSGVGAVLCSKKTPVTMRGKPDLSP